MNTLFYTHRYPERAARLGLAKWSKLKKRYIVTGLIRNEHVRQVQRALNLTSDAIFGQATDIAVTRFQASRGLTPDGIILVGGGKTWPALFSPQPASPPSQIGKLIVLDVGHGWKKSASGAPYFDPGACAFDLQEHARAEKLAEITREVLRAAGYRVLVLTKDVGGAMNYPERQAIAKARNASAYISLHFNAGGGRYSWTKYAHDVSIPLARKLEENYVKNLGTAYKAPAKLVLGARGRACISYIAGAFPAVLSEPLFLDNHDHAAKLQSDKTYRLMAEAIRDAI